MTPNAMVTELLKGKSNFPQSAIAKAFAPANIALCKYWGKRDTALNLPVTNSFSISLGSLGAETTLSRIEAEADQIQLNGQIMRDPQLPFVKRMVEYLDLFRFRAGIPQYFSVDTQTNLPIEAGVASSASGFAALAKALNALYGWELTLEKLSILARVGSGSACRSLWSGFVEWQKGEHDDGLDSHGLPWSSDWTQLRLGLLWVDKRKKEVGSREAMNQTSRTSQFYHRWPQIVAEDLANIKLAVQQHNIQLLGQTAESNALSLHALMLSARPAILYMQAETIAAIHQIWECRRQGLEIYFTQDAGPNLKLIFLEQDQAAICQHFPRLQVVSPWEDHRLNSKIINTTAAPEVNTHA